MMAKCAGTTPMCRDASELTVPAPHRRLLRFRHIALPRQTPRPLPRSFTTGLGVMTPVTAAYVAIRSGVPSCNSACNCADPSCTVVGSSRRGRGVAPP